MPSPAGKDPVSMQYAASIRNFSPLDVKFCMIHYKHIVTKIKNDDGVLTPHNFVAGHVEGPKA